LDINIRNQGMPLICDTCSVMHVGRNVDIYMDINVRNQGMALLYYIYIHTSILQVDVHINAKEHKVDACCECARIYKKTWS